MKKYITVIILCMISLSLSAQKSSKNLLTYSKEEVLVDKTNITINADSGIPVYFKVLRLNGEVIGIQPVLFSDGSNKNISYSLSGKNKFYIPIKLLSSEQIDELTAKYEAKAAEGNIIMEVGKYLTMNDSRVVNPKLPGYLKFSIEKLYLK